MAGASGIIHQLKCNLQGCGLLEEVHYFIQCRCGVVGVGGSCTLMDWQSLENSALYGIIQNNKSRIRLLYIFKDI